MNYRVGVTESRSETPSPGSGQKCGFVVWEWNVEVVFQVLRTIEGGTAATPTTYGMFLQDQR
jgi:hypothetical protein